jgi:ribbon-helix-helix CopG family protein
LIKKAVTPLAATNAEAAQKLHFFQNFAPPFPENKVMDKININKQNNHNAVGANRRGQRAKINFRAGAGQRVRTVTPLAKTPAVQILTISNVPSDILEAIDELAARQDRSRSSFVRRELERTVAEYQAKEALSKSR